MRHRKKGNLTVTEVIAAIGWQWIIGLIAWTVITFRIGFGIGRMASDNGRILPISPTRISSQARAQIDDALRRGARIEAIKILRNDAGCGLAEAKKTIETMRGQ